MRPLTLQVGYRLVIMPVAQGGGPPLFKDLPRPAQAAPASGG